MTNVYDGKGRIAHQTFADGSQWAYEYQTGSDSIIRSITVHAPGDRVFHITMSSEQDAIVHEEVRLPAPVPRQ